jgi:hypothetical protein
VAQPAAFKLRHRFEVGKTLHYFSKTVERGRIEVTIEMQTAWTATKVRPSGEGEVEVVVESYTQRVFPASTLSPDVRRMNEGLAGARFKLLIPPDGRGVEHLGQQGVPELAGPTLASLKLAVAAHVLRLPEDKVSAGKRWSREQQADPDAGPRGITSRSNWRVLSVRHQGAKTMLELVCLTSMEPAPLRIKGLLTTTKTEFHYSYLWNVTDGVLDGVTSTGNSVLRSETEPDAGAFGPPHKTTFEASLRLLER